MLYLRSTNYAATFKATYKNPKIVMLEKDFANLLAEYAGRARFNPNFVAVLMTREAVGE